MHSKNKESLKLSNLNAYNVSVLWDVKCVAPQCKALIFCWVDSYGQGGGNTIKSYHNHLGAQIWSYFYLPTQRFIAIDFSLAYEV